MKTHTPERQAVTSPSREKTQLTCDTRNTELSAAAIGTIFARTEKKYLIDVWQMQRLIAHLAEHMQADRFGKTHITSLYLDTSTFYLMRQSIEKPLYKEKYRIRWYGNIDPFKQVFFEVKKKLKGTVYKRRVPMTYDEAMTYTLIGQKPRPLANATHEQAWEGAQILREFDYAFSFYGGLEPALEVAYDRTAFVGIDDPDLRITFDTNITWRPWSAEGAPCSEARAIIDADHTIMEVKCTNAMPTWLTALLDNYTIRPQSFSKAGAAYKALVKRHARISKGAQSA